MPRKILRILLLLLSPFASLGSQESEAPETVWVKSPKHFNCNPSEISFKDNISISLGENSFDELAIFRESDKTWLFLVVGGAPEEMNSLMSPSELKSTKVLSLNSETTGFRWESNGYNEKIFTVSGKYTVYNSDNLESEVGGYKCDIVITGN